MCWNVCAWRPGRAETRVPGAGGSRVLIMIEPLGLAALGLVTAEWLALGMLSGVGWGAGEAGFWAARWALRLLVGAVLVAVAQLGLALAGVGFGSIPLVLIGAACLAGAVRLISPRQPVSPGQPV